MDSSLARNEHSGDGGKFSGSSLKSTIYDRGVVMRNDCTKAIICLALIVNAICATFDTIYAQNVVKDRAKLVADAQREGKVIVYVSSNASDAKALKSAFEKKYPFVQMEFL